ncbi:hypothetical protein ERJ75_000268500 [Trypanosoma vivax]|nr:hypothetical protein ERJ75_000268500 [Trypanosoma vivax]
MTFIPASQTASAGREVFINHGGAYWLNPVPADASRLRSLRTVVRSSDLIDPFGRPKRNDVPELYGKSRYTFNAAGTAGEPLAGETGDTVSENKKESTEGTALGDLQSPVEVNAAHCGTENNTYSSGELICEKLPLVTARPERRLLHPGNQAERIPPTGGSEYNGTVTLPWSAPRAMGDTYIRQAPTYESTTHYQLRTGRYYTEDAAPPHGMTLPTKNSLDTREW